jgi:hypothetical protein
MFETQKNICDNSLSNMMQHSFPLCSVRKLCSLSKVVAFGSKEGSDANFITLKLQNRTQNSLTDHQSLTGKISQFDQQIS